MPLFGRRQQRRATVVGPNDAAFRRLNPLRQLQANGGSLTAAGFRVRPREAEQMRRLIQPWQARSFTYYDVLGEIKYAAQFYSRMLAPLRLYAAELDDKDNEWVETSNPAAIDALERIQDPGGGRTNLLSSYGRMMFLTGECYLLVSLDDDTGLEQWEMLSSDELRVQGGVLYRYRAPSLAAEEYHVSTAPSDEEGAWVPINENDDGSPSDVAVAYRLWQRHPRFSYLADSTMQGVLDLCEELILLTQAVRARARSRLAGSGLLLIDESITAVPQDGAEPDEDMEGDPVMAALIEGMMSSIVDEGSASQIVPLLMRAKPGDGQKIADMMAHIQIVDPSQVYPETGLRYECIKRIAIGLDMPPEILLGMQDSNHWCVDDLTEILTADGWKHYGEFGEGDEVLTLNHETGMSEWQRVQDVASFDVEDLPMVSVESRFHSSLTTMNHRWPVLRMTGRNARWERDWTHSDELRTTHRLVVAAPSRDSLWPQWVKHDDALVELVAWLWTEGQIRERPGRTAPQVAIYQSHKANPENVLRIRAALTSLYGAAVTSPMRGGRGSAIEQTERWREVSGPEKTTFLLNAAAAARLLDYVSADRVVSTDFVRTLTASQLALFIDVSTLADGSTMRSGCQIVGQKDPERLAPLELAAILLGRSPVSYAQTHVGFAVHEQHYVSVSDRQTVRLKKTHIREERYTGTVWCPVTENATWCARRNGKVFFTGNTAWQIDEQTWKGHGQPKAQQLVDDLTSAYFRPYLRDVIGLPDWDRYSIGYDPAAVINHPDRSKDAKDLYNARAIGKRALRDAAGFSEDDAPTEDELAEMIGVAVRDSSLAWDGIPSVKAGGLEPTPGVVVNPQGESSAPVDAADSTGANQEKGPATGGQAPSEPATGPTSVQASIVTARILGGADIGLVRAREAAGSRVWNLLKKNPDLLEQMKPVRRSDLCATLGREKVRALKAPSDMDLVAGARDLILDGFRMFDVNGTVADSVATAVEQYAARTLYDLNPPGLPDTLGVYVSRLLSRSNGHGG